MTIDSVVQRRKDQKAIRQHSLRSVLTKTDRIISGKDLFVKFEENGPAPAYTDGETIWIDSTTMPVSEALERGFTPSTLHVATALNYHELAHCMFMPRLETKLVKDVRSAGAFFAFNILQDQTDETKFVTLFDPAKDYFIRLVTSYMMDHQEMLASNYPLVAGRLFLPGSLREKFKERFEYPEKIDRFDELIAEYKTLLYPDDQAQMYDVITAFQALLDKMQEPPAGMRELGDAHEEVKKGEPDTERSRELAQQEQDRQEEEDDSEGGVSDQEPSEEDDSEPEEEGEEDQGAGSDDTEDGSGAGSGDRDEKTLEEELEDTLEESYESVKEELEERLDAIKQEERSYQLDMNPETYWMAPPGTELLRTVEQCKDEFQALSERHSPGWHTSQRYGKLNHRQYAKALQGAEHVYRRWYEGIHDALDFEVTFLLDMSSSMGTSGEIHHACESLWVLRTVFDELDGITTVIGFSNGAKNLSQRGERASPQVAHYRASGGTQVEDALLEARRILGVSNKPLRFCVVITDGDFMDAQQAMGHFNDYGSMVLLIGINSSVVRYEKCRDVVSAMTINRATELVDVVKSFALQIARERQLGRTYG